MATLRCRLVSCSQPEGFVDNSDDCDDSASEANPSGVEVCDGLDNDCDGTVDGPDPIGGMTVYVDADGDGVGTTTVSRIVCTPEDDFVSVSGDCDDTDPSAFPGAEEVCDGVDNDCSGEADEGLLMTVYPDPDGDGYGMALLPMEACVVESGMSATAGDCDETDAAVHPGADEVCDGVDNDCSGEADEGLGITYYLDTDWDGFGVADMTIEACSFPVGYALTPGDCDNSDSSINPSAPETCDEVDNDCDGDIDDDDGSLVLDEDSVWFADADDDGFGDTDDSVLACVPLDGYIADDSDCDDDDPAAFPGAEEVWYDGVDQDCSGGSDFDADGDGRDAVASGGDDTDDEDPDCWDSCLVGVSPDAPADNCKAIAEDNPSAPNDWYWVDIDGSVTSVYCDIEAGGWTQCFEVENTFADDFGTSNDWMDDCVDLTMGSWSGNEVRVTLIDPSGETIYDEFGDRPTTWTYEHLTSTTYSGGQYHSEAHSGRWVNLSNGDKLLIPGRSSDNSGCGGSFGSGYAVLVYPPSPSYHSNVKMIVASYTLRYGSPRSFSGWSPSHEISYQRGRDGHLLVDHRLSRNLCLLGTVDFGPLRRRVFSAEAGLVRDWTWPKFPLTTPRSRLQVRTTLSCPRRRGCFASCPTAPSWTSGLTSPTWRFRSVCPSTPSSRAPSLSTSAAGRVWVRRSRWWTPWLSIESAPSWTTASRPKRLRKSSMPTWRSNCAAYDLQMRTPAFPTWGARSRATRPSTCWRSSTAARP